VWTDSHCHLQGEVDPAAALVRARAAGVTRLVCIGCGFDDSVAAIGLATTLGGPPPRPHDGDGVGDSGDAIGSSSPGAVQAQAGFGSPAGARLEDAGGARASRPDHIDPLAREAFLEGVVERLMAEVLPEGGAHFDRPQVLASVGLHPHDASDGVGPIAQLLADLATVDKALASVASNSDPDVIARSMAYVVGGTVVAVGECGLDYHYDYSERAVQREVFAAQIELAKQHGLALVIHSREAWDDTLSILAREGMPDRTIFHCFTGGPQEAGRCLDTGAYLSFSGIVTFKSADPIRAAAAMCPLDRLLVETDSPYLTPVPHRGRANEPMFVSLVGDAVAAARGVLPNDVAIASSANAATVFGLET
jgi:TatD DNase family protein